MKRLIATLTFVGALFVQVSFAFLHAASEHGPLTHEQEVVVTGHDERDSVLHIEAPFEVLQRHCSACVLDKRQAAAAPMVTRVLLTQTCCEIAAVPPVPAVVRQTARLPAPRAPPRVRFS